MYLKRYGYFEKKFKLVEELFIIIFFKVEFLVMRESE